MCFACAHLPLARMLIDRCQDCLCCSLTVQSNVLCRPASIWLSARCTFIDTGTLQVIVRIVCRVVRPRLCDTLHRTFRLGNVCGCRIGCRCLSQRTNLWIFIAPAANRSRLTSTARTPKLQLKANTVTHIQSISIWAFVTVAGAAQLEQNKLRAGMRTTGEQTNGNCS